MKQLLFLLLLLGLALTSSGQSGSIVRKGVSTDDIFYVNRTLGTDPSYHITGYGSQVQLLRINSFGADFVSDSANGKVYNSIGQSYILVSSDTAKTFNQQIQVFGSDTTVSSINGGENPGVYYFTRQKFPAPDTYFYTTDGFATKHPIANNPSVVGMKPGEYYLGGEYGTPLVGKILKTVNWGLDFDTIETPFPWYCNPYCVVADHNGIGLYNVVMHEGTWVFKLYYSPDNGLTWLPRTLPNNGSMIDAKFTAGRDSCTFYIVEADDFAGAHTYQLHIWVTRDCGETFTEHIHTLPNFIGLPEDEAASHALELSPNPATSAVQAGWYQRAAGAVQLRFYAADGRLAMQLTPGQYPAGSHTAPCDVSALPPGVYTVQLSADGHIPCVARLVICGRQ